MPTLPGNGPKPLPPALPGTREGYLAQRNVKIKRTLNDLVEDLHLSLADDPAYERLLYAVYDEQATEGAISYDNCFAAQRIREKAIAMAGPYVEVAEQKLATIAKCLGVVLRRMQASRKQRRNMVRGEIVADGNGND